MANSSGTTLNAQVMTFVAGADLTGAEGLFVKLDANGDIIKVAAITDRAIGVLRDGQVAGGSCGVYTPGGIAPVKVNATGIAPGDMIGVVADARGKKIAAADTTQYIHGTAVEASTAADEFVSVLLTLPTARPAA